MEAEISHGQLELREEKQMVRDISRLRAQRDRIREAEGRYGSVRTPPRGAAVEDVGREGVGTVALRTTRAGVGTQGRGARRHPT
jgi:hypothetical protein